LNTLPSRILITLGSAASIGFGVWHFFVPRLWDWYSYIDASATALVVAMREEGGLAALGSRPPMVIPPGIRRRVSVARRQPVVA
jgi:hypothetical protein